MKHERQNILYEKYVSVIKYLIISVSQPHTYTIKQIRKSVSSSSPMLNVSILLSGGNAGLPYTIQHWCLRISVTKRMLLSTSVISKGCWWEETYRLRAEWKPIPSTRRQRREMATPPVRVCGWDPTFSKINSKNQVQREKKMKSPLTAHSRFLAGVTPFEAHSTGKL